MYRESQLEAILRNGILSSRNEENVYSFSRNKVFRTLGVLQDIFRIIKGILYLVLPIAKTAKFSSLQHFGPIKMPKVLVIWPIGLWGGDEKSHLPVDITSEGYLLSETATSLEILYVTDYVERLNLALSLTRRFDANFCMSRLTFFSWCFSLQPYYLLSILRRLDKILHDITINSHPKNGLSETEGGLNLSGLFYPFELYPESKIIFYLARKNKLCSSSAQHMKWTTSKLDNYVGYQFSADCPDKLYISEHQDPSVFDQTCIKVVSSKWVGRYDRLLNSEIKISPFDLGYTLQVLTSGSSYDIGRGISFIRRMRHKDKCMSFRLVVHPKTPKLTKLLTQMLCIVLQIPFKSGFDGRVSSSLYAFTCGTSLYASLRKNHVRTRNLGGKYSQF